MSGKVTEYTEERSDDDNVSHGDFDIQYDSNDDEKEANNDKNHSNDNGKFVCDNDDMLRVDTSIASNDSDESSDTESSSVVRMKMIMKMASINLIRVVEVIAMIMKMMTCQYMFKHEIIIFFNLFFDSFYNFLNIFDSIRKVQLRDWEFKILFIYIVYYHFVITRQTFENSMNGLNDSIQNTNIIYVELIDSVSSINNHQSNDALDNLINAKHHHQGSTSDNNDYIMMQGNRSTRQTSYSCFAKTNEERDFYEKENRHTYGNKNRNRNRYHNNSHNHKQRRNGIKKSMEHRKSQSLKFKNEKSWHGINEDEITLFVASNQFIDECNNLNVASRLHGAFATQVISQHNVDFDFNDDISTNTSNDGNYTNNGCIRTVEGSSLSMSTGDSKGDKSQAITPDAIPNNRFNVNKKQLDNGNHIDVNIEINNRMSIFFPKLFFVGGLVCCCFLIWNKSPFPLRRDMFLFFFPFCFILYQVHYYYQHQMLLLKEKKNMVQQLKELNYDQQ